MTGSLPEGATATDLVLRVTELLRAHGVVGRFVEFYGHGLSSLTLPDRATIANMSPEYGATVGFFPVDEEALRYLQGTGRSAEHVERVRRVSQEMGLFRTDDTPDPEYTSSLELDLGSVVPSVAGPRRPQDRIPLADLKEGFRTDLPGLLPQGFTLSGWRETHRRHGLEQRGRGTHDGRGGAEPPRGRVRDRRCRDGDHGWEYRDRRNHFMYEYLEPVCDGWRRAPCQERRGKGSRCKALGKNLHGPRVQGGHRLSRCSRPLEISGGPALRRGWLRLHHMHRKLRSSPCAHRRSSNGKGSRRVPRYSRGIGISRQESTRWCEQTTSPLPCSLWPLR